MPEKKTVTIKIGGAEYEIGPLRFKQLKPLINEITTISAGATVPQQIDLALDLVAAALAPTHPELTTAEIEERLLASEISGLMEAVPEILRISGWARTQSGTAPEAAATA